MKKTRQGIRDLNGPNMQGTEPNRHPKQHFKGPLTKDCAHESLGALGLDTVCNFCLALWDPNGNPRSGY